MLDQPTPWVTYQHVPQGAAVKVEEYDDFYDLDLDLGICLEVRTQTLGCMELQTPLSRGGVHETVLLWDNGDVGPGVCRTPC